VDALGQPVLTTRNLEVLHREMQIHCHCAHMRAHQRELQRMVGQVQQPPTALQRWAMEILEWREEEEVLSDLRDIRVGDSAGSEGFQVSL